MPKTNTLATDMLRLYFENRAAAGLGDTAGLQPSGAAGSVYISLHTADPGPTADQTTHEISYTPYARIGAVRSGSGWTFASGSPNQESNAALVAFAEMASGAGGVVTHFGIGRSSSGAGKLDYRGLVPTPPGPLNVVVGITPEFPIGALVVTEQ